MLSSMTATPVQLHRSREREHWPLPNRVERLEEDADVADARDATLVDKIDRMNARLLGMILSTAGAAVAFAANLVLNHKG